MTKAEISPDDWAQFIGREAQWVIEESAINGFTPQYTRVADCIVDGRKGKLKLTVEFDEIAAL